MKLPQNNSRARRAAGILLTECLVYIAVFAVLLGVATAVFYFCWDHTRAVIYDTDDIAAALQAGEHWRADVHAATGKISVATTATGEIVTLSQKEREIIYRFAGGEVRRETPGNSRLLFVKVKTSQMLPEMRGSVNAWRWELQLTDRRKETHLPLMFTFEAARTQP